MGPTWVLSAPDGPHVGPMNLAMHRQTLVAYIIVLRFHVLRPWTHAHVDLLLFTLTREVDVHVGVVDAPEGHARTQLPRSNSYIWYIKCARAQGNTYACIWGRVYQKPVSMPGTSNYIPQILGGVITCHCPLIPASGTQFLIWSIKCVRAQGNTYTPHCGWQICVARCGIRTPDRFINEDIRLYMYIHGCR